MANFYDLPPEVVLKNTKTKIYADGSSTTTYCNNYIFVDKNLEEYQQNQKILQLKRKWEKFEKSQQEEDVQTDMFEIIKKPAKVSKEERGERTDILKRAKDKVFDIAFSNEWAYFLTITFNGSEYDFSNADFVKKKLRRWLENQVKRKDMKYLLIPERHKNGGIHCHALINDCFDMVDSGTRLVTLLTGGLFLKLSLFFKSCPRSNAVLWVSPGYVTLKMFQQMCSAILEFISYQSKV